jgi:Tol biopolymer transport system component
MTLSGLSAGSHSILLAELAPNCDAGAGANPRRVTVVAGDTAKVAFSVTCVATGSLAISIGTTGLDLDPNGYFITVDGGSPLHSGVVDAVLFTRLSVGAHNVSVSGVATNCAASPPSPIAVTISQSVSTQLGVAVACVAMPGRTDEIAFSTDQGLRVGDLFVVQADGTGPSALGVIGFHPAWSPVGSKIAFMCDRTVGGDGYYRFNLCVMGASGDGLVRLTNGESVIGRPTWAPDGLKLAFSRTDGLYVVGSDGTGGRLVYPASVYAPAWSPDGATIAIPCGADVCGVKPEGTGVAQLTNSNLPASAAIADPAWSPDGSRIAFTSNQFRGPDFGGTYYGLGEIAIMNRDGSGVTRLTPGIWGGNPSWSPDGTRIVFNTLVFSDSGCPPDLDGCGDWHFEIAVIRADGTQYQVLFDPSFGDTYSPAWMPR